MICLMSFGEFSKQYHVPRASVYALMKEVEKQQDDEYQRYVDTSSGTKKLTAEGIQYILMTRGLDVVETSARQKEDNDRQYEEVIEKLDDLTSKIANISKEQEKMISMIQANNQILLELMNQKNQIFEEIEESPKHHDIAIIPVSNDDKTEKKKGLFSRFFD